MTFGVFFAGLGIGFMAGIFTYRYLAKHRKREELTTEDCVGMLNGKGYGVRLYTPGEKK